jgi:large subunit ribosomal protein L25
MEILELNVEPREAIGSNRARQLRAAGKLPATLYGFETEPTSLAVDAKEFRGALRSAAGSHVLLRLLIDGKKKPTVILKELQRNPLRDEFLHVDFQSVTLTEKITAAVSIRLVGDAAGVKEGGILQHGLWELQVEALPTELPDHIEVDVSGLGGGQSLHVKDISLPDNLKIVSQPDEMVATILAPAKVEVEPEEVPVEGEEAEPAPAEEAPAES